MVSITCTQVHVRRKLAHCQAGRRPSLENLEVGKLCSAPSDIVFSSHFLSFVSLLYHLLHVVGPASAQTSHSPGNSVELSRTFPIRLTFDLVVYEPSPSPGVAGGLESAASMFGEGREDVPDSSSSQDQTSSNRGRSPRPHATPHHRPPAGRPFQPSTLGYPVSSPHHSTENIYSLVTSSPHHYSPSYHQHPGYVPHTLSTQPSVGVDHTPTPPYAYPQQYMDNTTVQQNLHGSYQPMMQPASASYQYPHHSPGGGSSIPSMFPHHQANASPHRFPPSPGGQGGAQSPPYHGAGQFRALHLPSPINPQYTYHSHSYPSSPGYASPYTPTPFGQHYPLPNESDRQAGWWYFPPQHQYESGPYPGHYSMPYAAGVGHHENSLAPSPSSLTAPGIYPTSSTRSAPSAQIQPTASPSPRITDTGSLSADASGPPGNRPLLPGKSLVRRPYHPNPPPHRSEWVMWAGNVPADATHDELWRFFNQIQDQPAASSVQPGVVSIFLISRSCCAFVNFETEAQLQGAIARFHGKALRPDDPRCPRLVCRMRRKDDDLKAGVGGQRGQGVHTRWVKDQKIKGGESGRETISTPSSPHNLTHGMSALSVSSDEEGAKQHTGKYSSSSGSYASTNSSILVRHFPRRYFILKSLTQVSYRMIWVSLRLLTHGHYRMTWILVLRRGCGRHRSTMRGSWIRHIGQAKRSF
jgi:hypothetical protein